MRSEVMQITSNCQNSIVSNNDSDDSQYSHHLITCAFNNFPPPPPPKILLLTLKRWTGENEVTTEVEPYPRAEF